MGTSCVIRLGDPPEVLEILSKTEEGVLQANINLN